MNNPTQTPTPAPSFLIGPDFISIMVNGTPFTIYAKDARYLKVLEVIKAKTWDKLESVINTAKVISTFTTGKTSIVDGVVFYGDKQLHNTAVGKILEFIREGYPYEPLVRFLDKLMENPSARSVNSLYQYIELYKMPICEDGDFIAYKVVKPDMTDYHSGTVDNSLGKIIEVPRNQVSDDPAHGCHFGLHIANSEFVKGFGGDDGIVILTKVNPRDVVSIPNDSIFQKMRVCRYEVIKVIGRKDTVEEFKTNLAANEGVSPIAETDDEDTDYSGGDMGDLDEGEPFIESNEGFPLIIPTGVHLTAISQERAYREHKAGNVVINHYDHTTIKPTDNKPRSFFRGNKSGWKMVDNSVSAPAVSSVINQSQPTKIGQNAAYEAHKAGKTVKTGTMTVYPEAHQPRSYFRGFTNWELVG